MIKYINKEINKEIKKQRNITATGNLIKQQLDPIASGLSDMMTNLFSGFMSNLQQQQQDQSTNLTNYLPIIGIAGLGIFLLKK